MARTKAKLIKLSREQALEHHLALIEIEKKYHPTNDDYSLVRRLESKKESAVKEYLEYNGLTSMQGDLYVEEEEY